MEIFKIILSVISICIVLMFFILPIAKIVRNRNVLKNAPIKPMSEDTKKLLKDINNNPSHSANHIWNN